MRRTISRALVNPPFAAVDGHFHVAVAVFVTGSHLDLGADGQAYGAALVGFRTLPGQRCPGVRICPAQLVQAKASRVMTPCLAIVAPIDAASASATNVVLMAVVCMMHRTIEAREMPAVVALMIGEKAADMIRAELRAN